MVVDDTGKVQVDVVLGHANLLRDFHNLDLDIDLNEVFGEWVDLDKTRVDGSSKATELGDQTNVTLRDGLVGIRAAETTRDCSHGSNDVTEGVDHGSVPAVLRLIFGVGLDHLRIGWLQIFTARRLDLDNGILAAEILGARTWQFVQWGFATPVDTVCLRHCGLVLRCDVQCGELVDVFTRQKGSVVECRVLSRGIGGELRKRNG